MLANPNPTYLLASHEPALLSVFEPVLAAFEVQVEVVLSAEPALAALTAPRSPSLAVIDANLPGMELGQFLATVRSEPSGKRVPIVLISGRTTLPSADLAFVDAHFGFRTSLDDLLYTMRVLVRQQLPMRMLDHHADQRAMTQWADST